MIDFSQSLNAQVDARLSQLHARQQDTLQLAGQAIEILIPALARLKAFFLAGQWGRAQEILFFRELKPLLAAKLIYYNELYGYQCNKPFGSGKALRKFYRQQLTRLDQFYSENHEFLKYYRSGEHYLDFQYFVRGKQKPNLSLDSFYLQADHRFCTSHDYVVARHLANIRLRTYLENELAALQGRANNSGVAVPSALRWSASKVALTELIYALHAEGVFNEGRAELRELASFFESAFQTNLGQYHRTFLEIRERKSQRSKFLTALQETLIARMDAADESQ